MLSGKPAVAARAYSHSAAFTNYLPFVCGSDLLTRIRKGRTPRGELRIYFV
jgi:hypothetical protein